MGRRGKEEGEGKGRLVPQNIPEVCVGIKSAFIPRINPPRHRPPLPRVSSIPFSYIHARYTPHTEPASKQQQSSRSHPSFIQIRTISNTLRCPYQKRHKELGASQKVADSFLRSPHKQTLISLHLLIFAGKRGLEFSRS